MEDAFFAKENYDLLLNVVAKDLNEKFSDSFDLDYLRMSLFNFMEKNFSNRDNNDTIDDLNKKTLISTVKNVIENDIMSIEKLQKTTKIYATDSPINVENPEDASFKKTIKTDMNMELFNKLANENEEERKLDFNEINEIKEEDYSQYENTIKNDSYNLLEETELQIKENYENSLTYENVINLDISSADRVDWTLSQSSYNFEVKFGSTETYSGISTPESLKNVSKIEFCQMVIVDTANVFQKFPFVFVRITELQNFMHSTSEHGRNSFVKLFKDKYWQEIDDSQTIQYFYLDKCSHSNEFLLPIGSLNTMSFVIHSPNGMPIENINDVFDIFEIVENHDSLDIMTNTFFKETELNVGNRIKFRDVISDNNQLEEFLMYNEHCISSLGVATECKMYNSFQIKKKEIIDTLVGKIDYPNYGSFAIESNCCKIMNLSLQTNLSLKIYSKKNKSEHETLIV